MQDDHSQGNSSICTRDYVETSNGLVVAVVADQPEEGRILGFPRYRRVGGRLKKIAAREAMSVLTSHFPKHHYYSSARDCTLAGVKSADVEHIYRAHACAQELLQQVHSNGPESLRARCGRLLRYLLEQGLSITHIGITGSLLLDAESRDSDIDLIIRDQRSFGLVQSIVRSLVESTPIPPAMWMSTYKRRNCSLSFDEYVWHERRKLNKFVWEGAKVDVSLAVDALRIGQRRFRKRGTVWLKTKVMEDEHAFASPASWSINTGIAQTLVAHTATYTGQARKGEIIEVQGCLEEADCGDRQIIVGTSREALGEWIRVISRGKY